MFLTHLCDEFDFRSLKNNAYTLPQVVRALRSGMCRENVIGLSPVLLTTFYQCL